MYCERCERVDYKYSKQNIRHEILIGAINLISMFFDYNDGVIGVHIDEHCMLLGGCSIYNIAWAKCWINCQLGHGYRICSRYVYIVYIPTIKRGNDQLPRV